MPKTQSIIGRWIRRGRQTPRVAAEPQPAQPDAQPALVEAVAAEPKIEIDPLNALKSDFDLIRSALGSEKAGETPTEDTVGLPLALVLELLPERYLESDAPDPGDSTVQVLVPDLFTQLSKGKVEVSVSALVMDCPPFSVDPAAYEDRRTRVSIPLARLVAAVDPAALIKRTGHAEVSETVEQLPDPFAKRPDGPVKPVEVNLSALKPESSETPNDGAGAAPPPPPAAIVPKPAAKTPAPVQRVEPAQAAPAPVEPVAATPPAPAPAPAPAPTPKVEAPRPATPRIAQERIGGVDLNTCSRQQLLSVPGATAAVADRILHHRATHGRFKDIFELRRVPRIGRKTFQRLTGMPYSEAGRHRSARLSKLLDLSAEEVYHLPTIAKAVTQVPGFTGCVVSDADGLLIVQHGAEAYSEPLAAIVPRMLSELDENFSEIGPDRTRSASIGIGDRMFTVIRSGHVYLSTVHDRRSLTKAQLQIAERVAAELAWLLSHRAYVASQS